jgi:CheY-like chemotaxis protein
MLDDLKAGVSAPESPDVLLIDDDPGVRDSLTMLLQAHGLSVVAAADGRRGLEAFRAHAPKLVLTDILMPEQDGIGAILQMRRERPDAKIVAMSGGGRVDKADYLTTAEKLGADAAVEKLDMEKLIEILLRLLKA